MKPLDLKEYSNNFKAFDFFSLQSNDLDELLGNLNK